MSGYAKRALRSRGPDMPVRVPPAGVPATNAHVLGTPHPGREDGVYVDVSYRKHAMTAGFVRVAGNAYADAWSCPVAARETNAAEAVAVAIALDLYPGDPVFCDCRQAVALFAGNARVRHVPRDRNPAHAAARRCVNPRATPAQGGNP